MAINRLEKITQQITHWLEHNIQANPIPWLADWKKTQAALFKEKGLPTRKNELYKHTPLIAQLGKVLEHPDFAYDPIQLQSTTSDQFAIDKMQLPDGVCLKNFQQATSQEQKKIAEQLETSHTDCYDPFQVLNDAFLGKGLWLQVPDQTMTPQPIWLTEQLTLPKPSIHHNRLLITIGHSSEATIIMTPPSLADFPTWSNTHVQILLQPKATLHYYYLPTHANPTVHFTTVCQKEASSFYHYAHLVENPMLRYAITTHLLAPDSLAHLEGLYIGQEKNYQEIHATVHHHTPHAKSNVTYRGVLAHRAHGVFYGNVVVDPIAAKTIAHQSHRGWAVHPHARFTAYPQLAIHNHDVTCTHHATLQKVEENALTYLQTRGISSYQATQLLVKAFLEEILNRSKVEEIQLQTLKKISSFLAIVLRK